MQNDGLDEYKLESRLPGEIKSTSHYADNITLMRASLMAQW